MECPQDDSIHILVAESTVLACELLANSLSRTSTLAVVGWEVDSAAVLATISRVKPDVALISSNLKDGPGKGLALVSELRIKHPGIRSVILLDKTDRQATISAFRAGARGVLSRGEGLAALPKCITRVSEGQVWASSTELDYLLDTLVRTAPTRTLSESCCKLLTAREQEVVQLVADGLGNREIAARLKLSQHTIKNYLFRVFDKVGVSSRVELVLCAFTTTAAKGLSAAQSDQAHDVEVGYRRRPETMTNA
ncbi:MAG: LuxR C-terminal-related transcriptional regulator [Terriglobales bacterium]